MTITTEQSNAATAAITALQATLTAYAAAGSPTNKDIYARDNMMA